MSLPLVSDPFGADDDPILAEAVRWMTRAQSKGLSASQKAAFRAWLEAAPEHVAAMDLVEQAWRKSPQLVSAEIRPRPAARRLRLGWILTGAAGVLAAVTLGFGVYGERAYETGQTQMHVQLADGTQILLDRGSRLRARVTPFSRTAVLERGQAEFDVVHDSGRPFAVEAGAYEIRDLGTRFAVQSLADAVQVDLLEGRVEVRDRRMTQALAVLSPGQALVLRGGPGATPDLRPVNLASDLAWRKRRLVFDGTSLREALSAFQARAGVEVELTDPSLAELKLSGTFDDGDLSAFLNAASRIYPLHWRKVGVNKYVISRRGFN